MRPIDGGVSVARRVLRQLAGDRRFLALSLVVPIAVIYLLRVFFEALESPLFDTTPYAVPVGAFIVHFIAYILCAVVLVRERTAQTLQRMFVSGYRRGEIIGGYVGAYSIVATGQTLLVLVELRLLFHLQYPTRAMAAIYLVIWLLAVISISLGIFVSNFARTEGQVFPFVPLVILPSAFLSGMIIPIAQLPGWARALSRVVPLTYAIDALRPITTATGGALERTALGGLLVYGVVVLALATLSLREQD